jgi:hypothetical protein
MPCKGGGIRLIICAHYLWEIALNAGHDVSFGNMYGCKGVREKRGS